jgi:hypothetical protein
MIPAIWRTPIVDAETATAYALDKGWDCDWAGMSPEQMVDEMRRVVPPLVLASAFIENEQLAALWFQWRLEKLKGDAP